VTFESHKVRRDALNPCFTKKYLAKLEPILHDKTTQLLHCFEKAAATDVPFNLSDAFFAYSNELVSPQASMQQNLNSLLSSFIKTFCFGTDDGLLTNLERANLARDNLAKLLRGIHWTRHLGVILSLVARWVPVLTPDHLLDLSRFKKVCPSEHLRCCD
jgi:cytochrome P450